MRVAQVIDSVRLAGGAERLQASFAEAMCDRDVELTTITLNENDAEAEDELRALGVRVVAFRAARFWSPLRAARLARFLRRERFDVVHAHLVRSTILALPLARASGIGTVATLHNIRPRRNRHRTLNPIEEWVLRHCTQRIIGVGWETARFHEARLGLDHIDVIPNAVTRPAPLSCAERESLRKELGVGHDEALVIAVGRLSPGKGFLDLIRAFSLLRENGVRAQLRIVGPGRQRAALQAAIDAAGLGDRVALLGLRRDVDRLLCASDIYASASLSEGLPVATLEAMAAGLPVVVTDVGDVRRVVTGEAGSIVPAGDPVRLAAALERTLGDPALRRAQSAAGLRRVTEDFDRDVWADRHLALYAELGDAGHPPTDRGDTIGEGRPCE